MSSRERSTNEQDWDDELDLPRWPSSSERRAAPSPKSETDVRGRGDRGRQRRQEGAEFPPSPSRQARGASRSPYPELDERSEPEYPPIDYPPQQRGRRSPQSPAGEAGSRRQSSRRSREPLEAESYGVVEDDWESRAHPDADDIYAPPTRRRSPGARGGGESRRRRSSRTTRERKAPSVSLPRPAVPDSMLAAVVGGSVVGLVLMAVALALRVGDLPSWIPIHLNASGDPDRWGSPNTLWRIPLAVAMCTIMSLVVAVLIWKRDAFAARFVVASSVLIQLLAWVAVIDALW